MVLVGENEAGHMKRKLLLVEDDPATIKITRYALKKAGYEVVVALDGLEGFKKVQSEEPDLIILDVTLPSMNGFQLCRLLRDAPQTAQLPILMLSPEARASDVITAFDVGADDYLTKNTAPAELIKRVKKLLTDVEDLRQSSHT